MRREFIAEQSKNIAKGKLVKEKLITNLK